MNEGSGQVVSLTNDWTEAKPVSTTAMATSINTSTGHCVDYNMLPYGYWPYVYTQQEPVRPIKLTMAEVERLKKAAKADEALKAILSKFTNQIEVIVSF